MRGNHQRDSDRHRGNLDWLASLFNFETLLTFIFINLSLLRLRKLLPDAERRFRVPFYPFTPILAIIGCVLLSFHLNPNPVITAIFFLFIGVAVYYFNRKGKDETDKTGSTSR